MSGATLHNLSMAAAQGHTAGLDAITPLLSQLSDAQFRQSILKDAGTLAHAAVHRCPGALNAIAPYLGRLNPTSLMASFPGTISGIIAAAEAGYPWALINISPVFQQLNRQQKTPLIQTKSSLNFIISTQGWPLNSFVVFLP